MKEDIQAGNRLIAEFDGWQSNKYENLPNKLHRIDTGEEVGIYVSDLEYHKAWSLLMPVVEKIASIPSITITIESFTVEHGDKVVGYCEIKRTFWPRHAVIETEPIVYHKEFTDKLPLIQNVCLCVIQFLKWHNPPKPEQGGINKK